MHLFILESELGDMLVSSVGVCMSLVGFLDDTFTVKTFIFLLQAIVQ